MGQTKGLVLLAGAALSLTGATAMAQQQSSDEVRAVVANMLADAETRSSLLASGDAGYDGKFFVAGDGFRLNVGGLLQFRYVMNFRDDSNADDFQSGFQTRRTKVDFDGQLNKDWFFRIRLASDIEDSTGVDYAYAGYKFAGGSKLTWGQFKLPFLREELVSDSKQLAAERSLTNAIYTQGYSQGVEWAYEAEAWRAFVAFSDGFNSANTDFTAGVSDTGFPVTGEADYAFTGRAEFLFGGNWKQFNDFTSPKGSDFGAMLGVAAHWQQGDNTNLPGDTDRQTFGYTADISFEGDSWNAFGAFIGRYENFRTAGGDTDVNDFGAVVQAGWRFAENTELFGRWDGVFADDDRNLPEDTYNFLTVGLNQYYAGHAAKATVDLIYALEDTSGLAGLTGALPNTGVGLLGDTEDGEVTIRLQFQVMF